jgi:hypothetical protein
LNSSKTDIEIINSARPGTEDYDFDNFKRIGEGGQAVILEVKSKIDGKIYICKSLRYLIGSNTNIDID